MPATSLTQAFRGCINPDISVMSGKVVATSPITVEIQDDSKLRVSEALLIIPEHLTNYKTTAVIDGANKQITIKAALQQNDKVILLSVGKGSLYLVIGRE